MPKDHPYKKRRRFTLKADPERSFQPQRQDGALINIIPHLTRMGLSLDELRVGLKAGYGSKPLRLPHETAVALYELLVWIAPIRLSGEAIEAERKSITDKCKAPRIGQLTCD
jgi:hypothetical protein